MKNVTHIISVTISALLFALLLVALQTPLSFAEGDQNTPLSSASLNWAGYIADSGGPYTAVTGSWVVPKVRSAGGYGRADATWVGVGGTKSRDLIQAGTEAFIEQDGSVTYQAWYETLPDVSIPISLAVAPGDSMTATITQTGDNEWRITIRNNTTAKEYNRTVVYDSSRSSVEWVEERVSDIDGLFYPLDNFGSVKFFNAFATVGGTQKSLQELDAQPLSMINGAGAPLAVASGIDSTTGSFVVSRSDTAAAPAYAIAPSAPTVSVSPDSGFIVITFGDDGITISQQGSDVPASAASEHGAYRVGAYRHHRFRN